MMLMVSVWMFLSGCSSVSRVPLPLNTNPALQTTRALVQTTISDPHAIAPTTQRSFLELCSLSEESVLKIFTRIVYTDCERQDDVQFTTASGYISGIAAPLLYSSAIAYAGHEIGRGLRQSGTTNNTTVSSQFQGVSNSSGGTGIGVGNGVGNGGTIAPPHSNTFVPPGHGGVIPGTGGHVPTH